MILLRPWTYLHLWEMQRVGPGFLCIFHKRYTTLHVNYSSGQQLDSRLLHGKGEREWSCHRRNYHLCGCRWQILDMFFCFFFPQQFCKLICWFQPLMPARINNLHPLQSLFTSNYERRCVESCVCTGTPSQKREFSFPIVCISGVFYSILFIACHGDLNWWSTSLIWI